MVTQQRHKVDLETIVNFQQQKTGQSSDIRSTLIANLFAQMNPFAPYVIQDVMDEAAGNSEERLWHLHESLFKKSEEHKVNPTNL